MPLGTPSMPVPAWRRCWLLLLALWMSAPAQDWSLVWSDEFDYTGLPDASKWGYEVGYVRNNEPQYYTQARLENASVGNGVLTITCRKETTPYNGATYTSASLITRGKASWTYGRIEMRAKLPSGTGAWPAFWTLGTSGGWPGGGEIDIMEYQGVQAATIFGTVHWANNGHQQQGATFNSSAPLPNEDFHVYAVEWFADRLDFYYDSNKYFTYQVANATVGTSNPFHNPQYILLNYALGGWLSGVDYTVLPQQYVVDYVRVYQASTGQPNAAPTVATAVAATPNPVIGSTATLSVLGADDGGEAALTYTWAAAGTPPAAVAFSANGSNAAKSTTATFSKAGSYTLQATIRDAGGLTATSAVTVAVNQTLTTIAVTPTSSMVATNGTRQFTATAKDQFTQAMASQPAITWTVSGGGTIASSGLFTAASTAGGPFTVTAASGGQSGTASVTVSATPPPTPAQAPTVANGSTPTPTFSGAGTSGDTVTIYDGGVQIGQTTVSGGGIWSWTVPAALASGNHSITWTDGNASGTSSPSPAAVIAVVGTASPGTGIPTSPVSDAGSMGGCGVGSGSAGLVLMLAMPWLRRRRRVG